MPLMPFLLAVTLTECSGGANEEPYRAGTMSDINHMSDQHRLFADLFRHYVKDIRPVLSHADVIDIKFEIALFNVLSLDSKTGLMSTNAEIILEWTDPYLTWDPKAYNGTHIMRVPHYNIWEPDIILYNSASPDYASSVISTNAIIDYTGEVKLLRQAVFISTCNIDIQWYPFDQQTCDLYFGSRTGDIQQIILHKGKSDISRYQHNTEFVLENFYVSMDHIMDPCCTSPFALVSYHIQLQRRVKFALFFFIIPGVLINICAVLVFSLPAESGEKVGLGINSMLAMMVFLMAMIENLPPAENIPIAGLYYGVCLCVITANIFFSVYVLNLNFGGQRGHPLPPMVKHATKIMAKALRVQAPPVVKRLWDKEENEEEDSRSNVVQPLDGKTQEAWVANAHPTDPSEGNTDLASDRSVTALEEMVRLLKLSIANDPDAMRNLEIVNVEEWKMASRVLDKFLFLLFSFATLLFNIIILTQSPYGTQVEYCDDDGVCHDTEWESGEAH